MDSDVSSMSVALIGAGAMGRNHARVLSESSRTRVDVVVDACADAARVLADKLGARWSTCLEDALSCDAAVVASTSESHLSLGLALLDARVPVLIEKPLAPSLFDATRLVERAEQLDVPLMCGFVERFNAVVRTAQGLLVDEPRHLVAVRHSPPNARQVTSVVHDLLIHDIDLALRLAGGAPRTVHGCTWAPAGTVAELADATVQFQSGAVATLSASRISQRKTRTLTISTDATLIELDLLRQDVTVYRHVAHEQVVDGGMSYRSDTIVDIPFVRHAGEPLALQLDHFCDLVAGAADARAERATLLAPHAVAERVSRAGGGR